MARPITGNIQHRGTSFRIRYYDKEGTRHQETFRTFAEAEIALAERLRTVQGGEFVAPRHSPSTYRSKRLRNVSAVAGVYFLFDVKTGLTKIGHSAGAGRRVTDLTTASATYLQLVALYPTFHHALAEKFLHRFFKNKHKHGEWFLVNAFDIERGWCEWILSAGARPSVEPEVCPGLTKLPSSVLLEVSQ